MWTLLLDPVTQGIFALIAVFALAYVTFDLFEAARDPSPTPVFARRRARPQPRDPPRPRAPQEACVETWRDASGETMGRVLRGPCRGMRLEQMSREECETQAAYARDHDPASAATLEAYIRQRFAQRRRYAPRQDGAMTRAAALAELGLREGASEAEIHSAWRAMIKAHHPDHGGSHARAARINAAKAALES